MLEKFIQTIVEILRSNHISKKKMHFMFNGWSIKYEKTAQWVCIMIF